MRRDDEIGRGEGAIENGTDGRLYYRSDCPARNGGDLADEGRRPSADYYASSSTSIAPACHLLYAVCPMPFPPMP